MIGGNRSFGLGGYIGTPVAEVLPVELVPPQTEKKRLNVAVQLVLDKSGSMKENNKMFYALEAARQLINNLKDDDYIGLIAFDRSPFPAIKMGRLAEIRDSALDRLRIIIPNGPTNLIPAIEEARRSLGRAEAGRKHMLILTDGQIPDSGPFYLELIKDLRTRGITVSTVLLGGELDDGLLKQMAEYGGGAFYQTADARALPRIFLNDVRVSTGERTMKEQQEFQVRSGPAGLRSTTVSGFPPVRGYVQTRPREAASLELVTLANDKAEPLLASWSFRQGRAAAFTSDANGRWSNDWVRWSRFHEFWGDIVDSLTPEQGKVEKKVRFDLRYSVERGALLLDLSLYSQQAEGGLSASLIAPDGTTRNVEFSRISAGHYQASLPQAIAGRYEFKARANNIPLTPVALFLDGELFGEKKDQGYNLPLLERLAGATGGKINPEAKDFATQTTRAVSRTELAPWLLALALLLVLAEILNRTVFRSRSRSNLLRSSILRNPFRRPLRGS
jgi:uncharacterized membrane protein